MATPDWHLDSVDLSVGRTAETTKRAVLALRDDADVVTLLGDASRVVPASNEADPDPMQLVVETVASGSTQDGAIEWIRHTVEVVPLIAPGAYSTADPLYLQSVRDAATDCLSSGSLGGGWQYRGATDDIAFAEPRSAGDTDALMQYAGRIQFLVPRTRSDGA